MTGPIGYIGARGATANNGGEGPRLRNRANSERREAEKARAFIVLALRDLDRGDRVDCYDSLQLAINHLAKSRAATLRRLGVAKAGA